MATKDSEKTSVITLAKQWDQLNKDKDAKRAEILAEAELAAAESDAAFDEKIAVARVLLEAHEDFDTYRVLFGAQPAPVKAKDEADSFFLVRALDGETIKDEKGEPVGFKRCMATLAPRLRDHLGDDLSTLAVKGPDGKLHHHGKLAYRAVA